MADWLSFVEDNGSAILSGTAVTLLLTICTAVLGTLLGIVVAVAQRARPKWFGSAAGLYIEVIRDTPFIVQLFFVFFGLPSLGLRLGSFTAALLTMVLNFGAYATEIFRAGFLAVPRGQQEAGQALGLHNWIIFVRIVLPQTLAAVFPALASQVVLIMLDSAVVSQIALRDLTFEADVIQARTFRAFETYGLVTLLYLGLSFLVRRGLGLSRRGMLRWAA